MSVISMVLVVIVAFLAGMEGVLDEFQLHLQSFLFRVDREELVLILPSQ